MSKQQQRPINVLETATNQFSKFSENIFQNAVVSIVTVKLSFHEMITPGRKTEVSQTQG